MSKRFTILGALALAAVLSAPARGEDASAETVVATVNGVDVTLGQMIALRQTLPESIAQYSDQQVFDKILDVIVQQTTLAQIGEKQMSKREALELDSQRRIFLAGVVANAEAAAAVTDEAIKKLYEERFTAATPTKEYNAAHILVATEDEAKAIKAELDGGTDFDALAKEKSTGPSAQNAGDLGWFGQGQMVKPFEDAVIAMKPGEISNPVETQFGWHIIKLKETRDKATPKLEDVRAELTQELQQKAVDARVAEEVAKAEVTKKTEGLDPTILKNFALIDN
jgi:peptidyl-prolyl cis-trans isomerase C